MNKYIFILGRKPLLSIAEIVHVLEQGDRIVDIQRESLMIESDQAITQPREALDKLGGTIKIAQVFAECDEHKIVQVVSDYFFNKFQYHNSKFNYGVSVYNLLSPPQFFLKKILINLKKELRKKEFKSRFVNHDFKNLENAAIKGEKLLEEGSEVILVKSGKKFFVAETVALQDFENYSHRDYDRPARDARLGMLPPKLAQMMINFSGFTKLRQAPSGHCLYDPFAGMGTILSEALLLGYDVIGSDIDANIIRRAEQNLQWIAQQFQKNLKNALLFPMDATQLDRKKLTRTIDLVVTESYLGPPVSKLPTPQNITRNFDHIREMTLLFFKNIQRIVKPHTPIVICFPFYREKNRYFFIENIAEQICKLGFRKVPLIPKELVQSFQISQNPRSSLIYDRPDQVVGREIFRFEKV